MSYDVGKATEGLEKSCEVGEVAEMLKNELSDTFVASPTSQFILQPFFRFSYVTSSSLNSPVEPPMAEKSLKSTDE